MDVKISLFNKSGNEKDQLVVEMKQMKSSNAASVIASTIQSWGQMVDNRPARLITPFPLQTIELPKEDLDALHREMDKFVGASNETATTLDTTGSYRIGSSDAKDLLEAVKETAEIGDKYPDIKVTGVDWAEDPERTVGDERPINTLVAGVKQALVEKTFHKRKKEEPSVKIPKVLTEALISSTPVHVLRSYAAHTPWLHISKYSRLHANVLRRAMIQGLREYNARIEQGENENDIRVTIDTFEA